jgi:hypothetical protein
MGSSNRLLVPRGAGRPHVPFWLDDAEALVGEALLWVVAATPDERRAYATACFIEMTAPERRHVSAVIRKAVRG